MLLVCFFAGFFKKRSSSRFFLLVYVNFLPFFIFYFFSQKQSSWYLFYLGGRLFFLCFLGIFLRNKLERFFRLPICLSTPRSSMVTKEIALDCMIASYQYVFRQNCTVRFNNTGRQVLWGLCDGAVCCCCVRFVAVSCVARGVELWLCGRRGSSARKVVGTSGIVALERRRARCTHCRATFLSVPEMQYFLPHSPCRGRSCSGVYVFATVAAAATAAISAHIE